jgi:DNA-binding transcriptional ArsR family regulator
MVEYTADPLNLVFHSLADGTRRDMLRRLSRAEQTISELARPYAMSLAAIAKHVNVLEKSGLVTKARHGKEKVVALVPETIRAAEAHLSEYEKLWAARYDALDALLRDGPTRKKQWPPSARRSSPKTKARRR